MKKLVFILSFVIISLNLLKAQGAASLAGTRWRGTMQVPDPMVCLLKFDKDTVRMIYVGDGTIPVTDENGLSRDITGKDSVSIEKMTYKLLGDTLELKKISGGSPCGSEKGRYRAARAYGKMILTLLEDACVPRTYAVSEELTQVR